MARSSEARAAAAAILQRREVRRSFGLWCELVLAEQGLKPARHHRLLIDELQAVADGKVRRLMISLPPGSAKSTFASQLFPAWLLARGHFNVLAASHTSSLAERFSGRVQRLVKEHSALLGYGLLSEAKEAWTTDNECEYRSAGVGVGIAGYRADVGVIDDATRSRDDADSEIVQGRTWEWFGADFVSRLRPGGSIVVVGTRWSEGDLQGRLLNTQADKWRVVNIPALAEADDPLGREPGEPLWNDDGYGYGATLTDIREFYTRSGLTRDWNALYMGRPAPEEGSYFRREWLRPVAELPRRDGLRIYMGSDYAVSEGRGDWTVHVVVGMDPEGALWLLDVWRAQASSEAWVEAFCDLVVKWKPIGAAEETGQIRSGVGPFLDRRMRERGAFVHREAFPTRGDKSIRAQSIRGRMALQGLYLPAGALWRAELEAELMNFPAGKHDDHVDALGLVGQLLDRMVGGQHARPKLRVVDSWDRAFRRVGEADGVDGWRVA